MKKMTFWCNQYDKYDFFKLWLKVNFYKIIVKNISYFSDNNKSNFILLLFL